MGVPEPDHLDAPLARVPLGAQDVLRIHDVAVPRAVLAIVLLRGNIGAFARLTQVGGRSDLDNLYLIAEASQEDAAALVGIGALPHLRHLPAELLRDLHCAPLKFG